MSLLVPSRHHHVFFDRSQPPALRVPPESEVTFETLDACYGQVRSLEDLEAYQRAPSRGGDPITGPVHVEGAQPGQTLVVKILRVELDETGFQLIGPNRGVIRDEFAHWECCSLRVKGDRLIFPDGRELPIQPVVGTLGNAPRGERTNRPNPLGGNLDTPAIGAGATVYLPIEVDGARFSLGDVHARQGDGEIVGAPEFGARVTVRLSLTDRVQPRWPMVEDRDCWHTIASGSDEAEAVRIGVLESARFIERQSRIPLRDALFLLTMTVRLTISRTSHWRHLPAVVCVAFPKKIIGEAAK